MKVTKTVRVKWQLKKLSPTVAGRCGIKNFGDAVGQNASENLMVVSIEEVFLERAKTGCGATSFKQDVLFLLPLWTLPPLEMLLPCFSVSAARRDIIGHPNVPSRTSWVVKALEKPPDDDAPFFVAASPAAAAKSSYVPPSIRAGAARSNDRRGRDENSIQVINLSEDTREQDLQELFRPFGPIS